MRHVRQAGLEVELTDHLGYEPHARSGRSDNACNGFYARKRPLLLHVSAKRRTPWRSGT